MSAILLSKRSIENSQAIFRHLPSIDLLRRRWIGNRAYSLSHQAKLTAVLALALTEMLAVVAGPAMLRRFDGMQPTMLAALAIVGLVAALHLARSRTLRSSADILILAGRDIGLAAIWLVGTLCVAELAGPGLGEPVLAGVAAGCLVLVAGRACLFAAIAGRPAWWIERVVVVGREKAVSRMVRTGSLDGLRVCFTGAVLAGSGACGIPVIDRIGGDTAIRSGRGMDAGTSDLLRRADRFLLLRSGLDEGEARQALDWLDGVSQEVRLLDMPRLSGSSVADPVGTTRFRPPTLPPGEMVAKRAFDIAASGAALLLLLPALVLVAILIRLESRGPALFRQARSGCNNLPFTVLKFRTMRMDAKASDGSVQAVRGDTRVTRLGAILRKTSIDELPQLLNVLGGSMSLVGPRPHPIALNCRFEPLIPHYAARHSVPPGITGWAQVNGLRGETSTVDQMRRRVEFDLEYVRRRSTAMDLLILIRTVGAVLADRNVY